MNDNNHRSRRLPVDAPNEQNRSRPNPQPTRRESRPATGRRRNHRDGPGARSPAHREDHHGSSYDPYPPSPVYERDHHGSHYTRPLYRFGDGAPTRPFTFSRAYSPVAYGQSVSYNVPYRPLGAGYRIRTPPPPPAPYPHHGYDYPSRHPRSVSRDPYDVDHRRATVKTEWPERDPDDHRRYGHSPRHEDEGQSQRPRKKRKRDLADRISHVRWSKEELANAAAHRVTLTPEDEKFTGYCDNYGCFLKHSRKVCDLPYRCQGCDSPYHTWAVCRAICKYCPPRRIRQGFKGHESSFHELFHFDNGHATAEYGDKQAEWALRARAEHRRGIGSIPKDRFERMLEELNVSPDLSPVQSVQDGDQQQDHDHHGQGQHQQQDRDHHGQGQNQHPGHDHHGQDQNQRQGHDHHGRGQNQHPGHDHYGQSQNQHQGQDHHGQSQNQHSGHDRRGHKQESQRPGEDPMDIAPEPEVEWDYEP